MGLIEAAVPNGTPADAEPAKAEAPDDPAVPSWLEPHVVPSGEDRPAIRERDAKLLALVSKAVAEFAAVTEGRTLGRRQGRLERLREGWLVARQRPPVRLLGWL
jgi:hypothetical protein